VCRILTPLKTTYYDAETGRVAAAGSSLSRRIPHHKLRPGWSTISPRPTVAEPVRCLPPGVRPYGLPRCRCRGPRRLVAARERRRPRPAHRVTREGQSTSDPRGVHERNANGLPGDAHRLESPADLPAPARGRRDLALEGRRPQPRDLGGDSGLGSRRESRLR